MGQHPSVGHDRVPAIAFGRAAVLAFVVAVLVLSPPSRPSCRAQQAPGLGAGTPARAPAAGQPDLSTSFRFIERYSAPDGGEQEAEGAIGQYRVAYKETIRAVTENPQGAPTREETVFQAIYSERAAAVDSLDPRQVTDAVRHYEAVRASPDTLTRPSGTQPFRDLDLWIRKQPGLFPLLMVLTPDRTLQPIEYETILKQAFVPDLAFLLPEDLPVRVGETWPFRREGRDALMGTIPWEGDLNARLAEVRPEKDGPRRIAVIDVTGQVSAAGTVGQVASSVHARIQFAFNPAAPEPGAGAGTSTVEARGAIIRVSMAQDLVGPLPNNPRLKRNVRRELILERKPDDAGAALNIPQPPPLPTAENSFLPYDDPQGRFSLRFPQGYVVGASADPDVEVVLQRQRADGADDVILDIRSPSKLQGDALKAEFTAKWKGQGQSTGFVMGDVTPLPAADWGGRQVVHFEGVLTSEDPQTLLEQRLTVEGYALTFDRSRGLLAYGLTDQIPPDSFREQVEEIIKTFRFSNSAPAPRPAASPAAASPGTAPAAAPGAGGARPPGRTPAPR